VLQHVSLETRPADVDAMLAFLALVGFERVEPPGSLRETSAWAERAGTQVHLLFADDPVVPPSGHAAVVVDDYDATLARLRAAGHPVQPRAEPPSARRARPAAARRHSRSARAAAARAAAARRRSRRLRPRAGEAASRAAWRPRRC